MRAGSGIYYAPTLMSTFVQSILFNGANPELGYSVSTTNAAALAAAFQATGVNLSQAPLDNLPVFSADQVYRLLGSPVESRRAQRRTSSTRTSATRAPSSGKLASIERSRRTSSRASITRYINTTGITRQRDINLGTPVPDATGRLIYSNSTTARDQCLA